MKHTEVPNEMTNMVVDKKLEHGDKLVYASVRRYMNPDNRGCYPAIGTIASKLNCSRTKISSAINRLVENGLLLKREIEGKSNYYIIPKTEFDKKFEMFTDEFLDMDLPLNVKEFYIDIQQFLYNKESGIGRCSFNNTKLSRLTGWTVPSIRKYKSILIEKGLLTEEETSTRDESGLPIILQSYNLTGLNQAALWVKAVTEQLTTNTEDIAEIKKRLDSLEKENRDLKKQISLNRNYTEPFIPPTF